MKKDTSFHDFVIYDLMNRLSNISSRPMMSGWCIYSNKIPFAAIIGNELFFKIKDDEMKDKMKKLGSLQFKYKKKDKKVVVMSYWSVPEEAIDNSDLFFELANKVIKSIS
ncbi:MAG: TfoX/Sxy family protein [Candidatus Pacebacteria bacterium]|nr:TfoX/Sxy family protein [Candidatus Paceibacterota bacterium]